MDNTLKTLGKTARTLEKKGETLGKTKAKFFIAKLSEITRKILFEPGGQVITPPKNKYPIKSFSVFQKPGFLKKPGFSKNSP